MCQNASIDSTIFSFLLKEKFNISLRLRSHICALTWILIENVISPHGKADLWTSKQLIIFREYRRRYLLPWEFFVISESNLPSLFHILYIVKPILVFTVDYVINRKKSRNRTSSFPRIRRTQPFNNTRKSCQHCGTLCGSYETVCC